MEEELELIEGVYPKLNLDDYLKGKTAPLFFGSALNNFGVKDILDCFIQVAPSPGGVQTEEREVFPDEPKFSGFVFKIHANMDPNHRDRLAFIKIVSGEFERNKGVHPCAHRPTIEVLQSHLFYGRKEIGNR